MYKEIILYIRLSTQLSDGLAQSKILIQDDQIELNCSIATFHRFHLDSSMSKGLPINSKSAFC